MWPNYSASNLPKSLSKRALNFESALNALVALCQVREAPRQQRRVHDRSWGSLKDDRRKLDPLPMTCTSKQCIFCFSDTRISYESRTFSLCHPRKPREHVEQQHLRFFNPNDPIPCPHPVLYVRMLKWSLAGSCILKTMRLACIRPFYFPTVDSV